jgi:hypothetical protein
MPRIPTQQWCLAQEDPKKRHQWAFVASMVYGSGRYTPDDDSLEVLSERVPEAGYIHVSDLEALADAQGNIHVSQLPVQTKKLKLPPVGQHHTLNNTSAWVDMDEEDAPQMVSQDMTVFTAEQNRDHIRQLQEMNLVPTPEPASAGVASVVTEPPKTFDPTEHSPSVVVGYLLGQDDTERRRVVAMEMRGKRRERILNHPDWRGL